MAADNDWDGQDPDEGREPKWYRDQIKAKDKELQQLQQELTRFRTDAKKSSAASILKKAGANPGIARFVLTDLEDVTEESVNEWLKDNGEFFGFKQGEDADDSGEEKPEPKGMSPEDLIALNAINTFRDTSNGAQTGLSEAEAALAQGGFNSEEDILAAAAKGFQA